MHIVVVGGIMTDTDIVLATKQQQQHRVHNHRVFTVCKGD